jgi:hypothetical protein
MSDKQLVQVKRSVLAHWRDQAMDDALEDFSKELELTDSESQAYARGFVHGWMECTSTMSMHKIFKLVID